MRNWQAIHYKLNATTAVTALTGRSIYHGIRPANDQTDYAINYFILPGPSIVEDTNGTIENPEYQISCRAKTPGNVMQLAQEVDTALHNLQEDKSGSFGWSIVKKVSSGGLIVEQSGDWYHIPLTYRFVFENTEN